MLCKSAREWSVADEALILWALAHLNLSRAKPVNKELYIIAIQNNDCLNYYFIFYKAIYKYFIKTANRCAREWSVADEALILWALAHLNLSRAKPVNKELYIIAIQR